MKDILCSQVAHRVEGKMLNGERVHRKNERPECLGRSLMHTRLMLKLSWEGFLLGISLLRPLHYIRKGKSQIMKDLLCCGRRVPETPLPPADKVRSYKVQKGQKKWVMKFYLSSSLTFSFPSSSIALQIYPAISQG